MKKLKNKNLIPKRGEVWYANFPLEEDQTKTLPRPVIVLEEDNENSVGVLSIKVTKHKPRDEWDREIFYWQEAKLKMKSTARISKAFFLKLEDFDRKLGELHKDDLKDIDNLFNEYIDKLTKPKEQLIIAD